MGLFKSRFQKIYEQMENEGNAITLSKETSDRINSNIAKAFVKIKEEYRIKAAASWNYMKGKYITSFTFWRKK